jgi:hypothetical protein
MFFPTSMISLMVPFRNNTSLKIRVSFSLSSFVLSYSVAFMHCMFSYMSETILVFRSHLKLHNLCNRNPVANNLTLINLYFNRPIVMWRLSQNS